MSEFHGIDMTQIVPQNFLTLSVSMSALNAAEIRAKYPGKISEKLLSASDSISDEIAEHNSAFAIRVDHYHYITKDVRKATDVVRIDNSAETGVKILKELKDPNDLFNFTAKSCIKEINHQLARAKVQLLRNGDPIAFNSFHLNLFNKYYDINNNSKLCYVFKIHNPPTYGYSMQTIDFIVEEIKKDPENIIQNLKEHLKKKKS